MTREGSRQLSFRRLHDSEVDAACAILAAASQWLLARGIRQWVTPYPRELYQQAQDRAENFALIGDDRLVAIVTLSAAAPPEWREELSGRSVWWISKLAVAPDCHGKGFGRRLAQESLKHLEGIGATSVWLDCVVGPLTSFYESLGFEPVVAKVVHFPNITLHVVLMTREL